MQNTSKMMIRFLILFQVIMNVTCFAADETSAYFITRVNKRLAGHVAKRFQSPSLMSCSHSCLRNSWCTSTNFKESLKENRKGTCELNKHEIPPINEHTELTDQPGVTFSMFLKVCALLAELPSFAVVGCRGGGPSVSKSGNQSMRKILVVTSAYDRPSARTDSGGGEGESQSKSTGLENAIVSAVICSQQHGR